MNKITEYFDSWNIRKTEGSEEIFQKKNILVDKVKGENYTLVHTHTHTQNPAKCILLGNDHI